MSRMGCYVKWREAERPFERGNRPLMSRQRAGTYVFALVELDEDPTVRVGTNIVGCDLHEVEIGMRVEVLFEQNGQWHVPLFRPFGAEAS